ncbi:hypothetical protein LSAT2_015081 [Lamellibrachia satsuma]|nr:hypothetical protein LSAT2_015081 [Lamellibrachia satsuma]
MKREADSSVESLLVDRAIENMMSLPDVVGEVALKQKEQTEELRKQQQQLAGATQQLNEEEKKVEKVKEELQSVKRQTWLMEEEAAQIVQQCQHLETDIEGVIHDNTEVTRQLELKHEALEQDGAVYRESVERMTKHIAQVEALESTCIHNQTLKMQKHRVDTLRQQKQELVLNTEESRLILTGVSVTRIQKDIEGLKTEVLQLDNKMTCSIQQVESEKDRQRQLKQDIQVLQKRNAAQLTRMRRLLKVSQCHNRQWGEQAKQLERTVSALKRQLEE